MHLAHYLGLLHRSQAHLAEAFRQVAEAHAAEPDIFHLCHQQARICDSHAEQLEPFARRYAEDAPDEPERLHSELFTGTRTGGIGLLRDLQDVVQRCEGETALQLQWLRTRMKAAAPQALVVAS